MFAELQKHVATKKNMKLTRHQPSYPILDGYLLGLSDKLGLMHIFDDFQPVGYAVFRVEDVQEIRCGKYERQWDWMLAGENLLKGLDFKVSIDLTNLQTAIDSIQREFGRIIIECEDPEEDIEDFYLGSVVQTNESTVIFDNFDSLGVWDKEPHEIEIEEITLLQFQTPYIHHFWKYVNGPPPHVKNPPAQQ